jgi:hypothetical protein
MSLTIDVAFVRQVSSAVHHLTQQKNAKLSGTVRYEGNVTGKTFDAERLGAAELAQRLVRHGPTNILNPEHTRRRAPMLDYDGAVLIDTEDKVKTLIDPQSEYTILLARARNRRFDRSVIAAFNGNATTVNAADVEAVATLAGFDGGSHVIANGGVGLTMAKIRQINRLFMRANVEPEDRHIAVSAFGIEDLLADATVTSADFSSLRALQDGTLENKNFMGMTWHVFGDGMLPLAGNIESQFAWAKDGIKVGEAAVPELEIARRWDLNGSWQVLAKKGLGAVRVEEALVVQCDIDITA